MFENHRKSRIACEASYNLIRQKLIMNAKNSLFWPVFENLKHAVKKCYQTGHFQKDQNWWKMAKLRSSNETF